MPVSQFLPIVSSLGFQGVWVDRLGYDDHGAQVERELTQLVGPPALVSVNGRFAFYDLRSYTAS
jgi:phosphoglycerol transferase